MGNAAAVNSEFQNLTLENVRGRRHPRAGGCGGRTRGQVGEGNRHRYRSGTLRRGRTRIDLRCVCVCSMPNHHADPVGGRSVGLLAAERTT